MRRLYAWASRRAPLWFMPALWGVLLGYSLVDWVDKGYPVLLLGWVGFSLFWVFANLVFPILVRPLAYLHKETKTVRKQQTDPQVLAYRDAVDAVFAKTASIQQVALVLLGEGGSLDTEGYVIWMISEYLMTDDLWDLFRARRISIAAVLNGQLVGDDQDQMYDRIFHAWNTTLGRRAFGAAGPFGNPYPPTELPEQPAISRRFTRSPAAAVPVSGVGPDMPLVSALSGARRTGPNIGEYVVRDFRDAKYWYLAYASGWEWTDDLDRGRVWKSRSGANNAVGTYGGSVVPLADARAQAGPTLDSMPLFDAGRAPAPLESYSADGFAVELRLLTEADVRAFAGFLYLELDRENWGDFDPELLQMVADNEAEEGDHDAAGLYEALDAALTAWLRLRRW